MLPLWVCLPLPELLFSSCVTVSVCLVSCLSNVVRTILYLALPRRESWLSLWS